MVATDAAGNASEQAVTVGVTNVDEVAPTISSSATGTALENQNLLYTASSTDATDYVAGATSYSLKTGGDAALLSINASTGAVTLSSGNLNYEGKTSYTFTVVATDAAGNASEQAVTVGVTNVDEVAPTISSSATGTALENQNLLYTASSTDATDYVAGATSYSLKTGGDAALLSINASTGAVTLSSGNLNYEGKTSYTFTVVATDAAGNASEQAVTVGVTNVDEVAPTISSSATGTALENQNLLYTASSTDATDYVAGATSYSLKTGGDAALLSINASTGAVTLSSGNLNYEGKTSYTFTVVATDAAGNASEQAVTVGVTNVDEVAPTISSSATGTALENQNLLYTASSTDATDYVAGATSYSLKTGGDAALLSINASTGAVTLSSGNLNYEGKTSYTFTVVATDAAGNASEQAVTVGVTNVDEVAPTISSSATGTALENQNLLYTASSTDATDYVAGATSYSLKTGGDAALLSINASTGAVTLSSGNLNYEGKTSYTFTVVATDAAGNASEQAVTVGVTNVDEVAPTISSSATGTALENQNLLYTASSTDATDYVAGATSYSLKTGGDAALLSINASTGAVTLSSGNLNYEGKTSYTFTVVATDAAGNASEQAVTVGVTNVDEVAPTISSSATGTALENQNLLYTASSTDATDYVAGATSYSLKTGGDAALLSINASTGAVTLSSGNLNYEGKTSYTFTVVATDAAGNASEQAVTVGVTNVDEVAPTISSSATGTALENQNLLYTASSTDATDYVAGATSYSLKTGGDAALLSINASTGAVTLSSGNLNYEGKTSYTFTVVATDAAGNASEQAVTVGVTNVDEVAPTISSSATGTALENQNLLYTASSTDATDYVAGATSYSLKTGGDAALLSINASTGAVTLSSGNLNYEGKTSYTFTVVATDAAGNASEQAVTVGVTNVDEVAPTISSSATGTALENQNLLYTASSTDATDYVAGATSYSLKTGGDAALLSINASTGAVTLSSGNLNYEGKTSYTFTVVATDAAGNASEQAVTVGVTNVDEVAPTISSSATGTALENQNLLYTASSTDATDYVAGATSYSLKTGGDAALLSINASTGAVTLSSGNLNYEGKTSYTFTVVATDAAGNASEQAVTVGVTNVDEVAPTISSSATGTALENQNLLYTASSTDATDYVAGATSYSLKTGGDAALLSINASTGAVTLSSGNLNYEGKTSYTFTVVATDAAGNASEQAVTVGVTNVDEVAPTISSSATGTALENQNLLYTASSTDATDYVAGATSYSLKTGGDAALLSINASTGAVTLSSGNLNYEGKTSYTFTVVATDAAGNASEQAVTVGVTNVDEVAPTISSSATGTALENQNLLYTASSTDATDYVAGATSYSLKTGGDAALLSINASTGAVTLSSGNLNYEGKTSYTFTVVATDAAGNASEQAVTVGVTNVDEVAPTISSSATGTALENQNLLYTASSTDATDYVAGATSYSLKTGGDAALLSINASTGAVTLSSGNLNYEGKTSYTFTVVATDAAGNASEQAVTVGVTNVDEVAPTISSSATGTALENQNLLYTASSTDATDYVAGATSYSLKTGGDAALLSINASTGAVTLSSGNLNYEGKTSYTFTVVATDAAGNASEQAVTVGVTNVDEVAPTISSSATGTALENQNLLYTASSTDATDYVAGATSYSLKTGGDAALLSINASTGAVTLSSGNLNYEGKTSYTFTVVATDAAGNASEQAVTVGVTNVDEVAPTISSSATGTALENQNLLYTASSTDATDYVAGATSYSLKTGGDAALLSINASTGAVTLSSGNLNYEGKTSYTFTVVATDAAGNASEQAVTVGVTNVDEVAPTISSSATGTALENQNLLYTASSTDATDYVAGATSYSLKTGGDAALLSINASTGAVTLSSGNLNYEGKTSYTFTVVATDAAGNASEQAVTVGVTNVDEVAPTISSSATGTALENQNLLYTASSTDATDYVAGATSYSLKTGGDAALLSINASTGAVTLSSGNLNYEGKTSYTFTVVATDAAGNASEQAVTVGVTNVDEVAPTISSSATGTALENQNLLYTASSTDATDYVAGATSYSLKTGGDAALLSINASTGAVTLSSGNLNYEGKTSYTFTVVATDAAGNASEQAVTVGVTNVDEVAPTISSSATGTALENQNLLYTASSTDATDYVAGATSYSLKTGGDAALLSINASTGAVTLSSGNLNYEGKTSYTFTVVATDAAGNASEQAVTVGVTNVDEVAPTISSSATGTALENQNLLYTASSTDATDYVAGATSYSLKTGGDAALLSINASTGAVTLSSGNLNYEGKTSYTFTVVATDAAGNASEQAVTVGVTNVDEVAPTISSSATGTALENQNLLYTASSTDATDYVAGATSYSLKTGGDAALLSINASTGAVTLSSGNLNYEGKTSYTFTVVATDAAGNASEQAVTVGVTNVDEVAPTISSSATGTALENQNLLYTASSTDATDYVAGATSYSLKTGGDAALLSINASTGAVTLSSGNLNYEGKTSYTFTVVATDAAGNASEQAVTVGVTNVDEVAPTISSSATGTALENQNLLYTASSTDATDYVAGATSYSLKTGGDAALLSINASTGAVTLSSGNLNYEGKTSYTFTVVATDAAGNASEQAVTVGVTNVDEVAPTISSSATGTALENQNLLYTASSTDATDYVAGATSYSLKTGGDAALLSINASTGAVTLSSGNLNYEGKTSYTFTVVATDAAGNASEQAVTVGVTNVDEVAPTISSSATGTALENQNLLYTASSTDATDYVAGATSYSLKTGGDAALLSINASTGAVTLSSGNLNYEGKTSYTFTVVATDAAGNASEQAVTVGVTNVDEVAPTISSSATGTALENQNLLYTASSTDATDYVAGATSYSLKTGGDAALLSINASTGAVTLSSGNLNYEGKTSYTFTVVATDAAGNASEQAVTVGVTNVDEVAPTISSSATGTALENQNLLYTASSTDATDYVAGATSYSLKTGGDAALLSINASTGAVTLSSGNLNYEGKTSYTFTVVATDAAGNASEQAVTVGVTNVDEVAPTISSSATGTALENQNLLYTASSTDATDYVAGGDLVQSEDGWGCGAVEHQRLDGRGDAEFGEPELRGQDELHVHGGGDGRGGQCVRAGGDGRGDERRRSGADDQLERDGHGPGEPEPAVHGEFDGCDGLCCRGDLVQSEDGWGCGAVEHQRLDGRGDAEFGEPELRGQDELHVHGGGDGRGGQCVRAGGDGRGDERRRSGADDQLERDGHGPGEPEPAVHGEFDGCDGLCCRGDLVQSEDGWGCGAVEHQRLDGRGDAEFGEPELRGQDELHVHGGGDGRGGQCVRAGGDGRGDERRRSGADDQLERDGHGPGEPEPAVHGEFDGCDGLCCRGDLVQSEDGWGCGAVEHQRLDGRGDAEFGEPELRGQDELHVHGGGDGRGGQCVRAGGDGRGDERRRSGADDQLERDGHGPGEPEPAVHGEFDGCDGLCCRGDLVQSEDGWGCGAVEHQRLDGRGDAEFGEPELRGQDELHVHGGGDGRGGQCVRAGGDGRGDERRRSGADDQLERDGHGPGEPEPAVHGEFDGCDGLCCRGDLVQSEDGWGCGAVEHQRLDGRGDAEFGEPELRGQDELHVHGGGDGRGGQCVRAGGDGRGDERSADDQLWVDGERDGRGDGGDDGVHGGGDGSGGRDGDVQPRGGGGDRGEASGATGGAARPSARRRIERVHDHSSTGAVRHATPTETTSARGPERDEHEAR